MADIKPDVRGITPFRCTRSLTGGSDQEDLRAYIDVKNIDCMNQNNEHPISSILRPSGKLQDAYLESSEDAQMIIDVSVCPNSCTIARMLDPLHHLLPLRPITI